MRCRSHRRRSIVQGATGTTTVTIARTNFTGAVTLSLGSAPTGVTGAFDPAAPTGTNSALTVSVGAAVAPGVYNRPHAHRECGVRACGCGWIELRTHGHKLRTHGERGGGGCARGLQPDG